ncbi:C-reactive protein 1.4-like [Centruroides sculpturatus]|uniref:C-reactive protein 1.4-like n=1 Tax=Centruroides sculpturatus TaxID=218467 RepID=UPI000C6D505F|nr:C-reactive protein 1.4-like [Centruroides sculpturatus]
MKFSSIISFILSISCCVATFTKFYFPPSSENKFPRLRLTNTLPTLQEFSFCSRVRPLSLKNDLATIISYASSRSDNELIIGISNNSGKFGLRVYLGAFSKTFSFLVNKLGKWNYICVSWFGIDGTIQVFTNGAVQESSIAAGSHIKGGGNFIVGQEQDAIDLKFDYNQSWIGDVADLHLWNEAFDLGQVKTDDKCGGLKQVGNVISLEDASFSAFDGVTLHKSNSCKF